MQEILNSFNGSDLIVGNRGNLSALTIGQLQQMRPDVWLMPSGYFTVLAFLIFAAGCVVGALAVWSWRRKQQRKKQRENKE